MSRHHPKRRFRTQVFAATLAAVSLASAGVASAAPPVGAPVIDIDPNAGASNSAVVPSATCAIRNGGTVVYWFGYTNSSPSSVVVPVGPSNSIRRTVITGDDAAQPDQFRPGTHRSAVAVRAKVSDTVKWSISSALRPDLAPTSSSVIAGPTTVACPVGTPAHSANMRVANATIRQAPLLQTKDARGRLIAATVRFSVTGARTVCSQGIALAPVALWGFNDGIGTSPALRAGPYAPIPASQVVRTDTFTYGGRFIFTADFERTTRPVRRVANPQAISTQFTTNGTVTARGLSQTIATVDLTASCTVGSGAPVRGATSFVGGEEGSYLITATNPATQSTRTALSCVGTLIGCDYLADSVGPGGSRAFR